MKNDEGSYLLLGVPIGTRSLNDIVHDALAAIDGGRAPVILACANPHSLVVAQSDADFKRALLEATHVVADGVGVTAATRLLAGVRLPRITGSDLFGGVLRAMNEQARGRVYLLGSTTATLELMRARMASELPRVQLVGSLSPPFGEWSVEEDDGIVASINEAQPDVLWVGMTAPKQEKWVAMNRCRLNVPVIGSVGAVFDYYAQNVHRAPQWLCDAGCEWLYRLVQQPRRLWRRTLLSAPRFLTLVLREQLT